MDLKLKNFVFALFVVLLVFAAAGGFYVLGYSKSLFFQVQKDNERLCELELLAQEQDKTALALRLAAAQKKEHANANENSALSLWLHEQKARGASKETAPIIKSLESANGKFLAIVLEYNAACQNADEPAMQKALSGALEKHEKILANLQKYKKRLAKAPEQTSQKMRALINAAGLFYLALISLVGLSAGLLFIRLARISLGARDLKEDLLKFFLRYPNAEQRLPANAFDPFKNTREEINAALSALGQKPPLVDLSPKEKFALFLNTLAVNAKIESAGTKNARLADFAMDLRGILAQLEQEDLSALKEAVINSAKTKLPREDYLFVCENL
ncbi:MAG: hypothetical protein ACTTIC_06160 [Helicobacteraceae bacterium]